MYKNKKFRTTEVTTISFAHFINDIYASFLAPILPLLIEKLSITYSFVGVLAIVQQLPSLFNPLWGILADKKNYASYFVIVTPTLTAISMCFIGLANHWLTLMLILLASGISSAIFHVTAPVIIKQVSGNKLGRGMSFFMTGGEIARTIGPIIILAAVSAWGLEGSYKLIPFGILVSSILFFRIKNIRQIHTDTPKNTSENYRIILKDIIPTFIPLAGMIFFRAATKVSLTFFYRYTLHLRASACGLQEFP